MSSRKTHLVHRIIYMLLFITLVYGGVIGFNRFMGAKILEAMASMPQPAVSVSVASAKSQTWSEELRAVASLQAAQGTTLAAQSSGTITSLYFKSGQTVKKDQLLVQLNNNVARAKLAADQARLANARFERDRQHKLYTRQATSQAALQSAEATYHEMQASVQSDQATLDNLQIRAPFDGHLGIRAVSLGQFIAAGHGVVDIQQWRPLRVAFTLPQRDLSRISVGDGISLTVDGLADTIFSGRITAMGAAFATNTRTIAVQARIENAKNTLRPGMFGEVTVRLAKHTRAIIVPRIAITYNSYGEYVYVIKDSNKGKIAEQRSVQTTGSRGTMVDIARGIQPGDVVVVAGQVHLYPGARVKIVPLPASLKAVTPSTSGS